MSQTLPQNASEFYDMWIAALRSNDYKQTEHGCLYYREKDEYCCLGVACDVLVKHNKGSWSDDSWKPEYRTPRPQGSYHPYSVSYSGLPELFEYVDHELHQDAPTKASEFEAELAKQNDKGVPFSEIANFLEINKGKIRLSRLGTKLFGTQP